MPANFSSSSRKPSFLCSNGGSEGAGVGVGSCVDVGAALREHLTFFLRSASSELPRLTPTPCSCVLGMMCDFVTKTVSSLTCAFPRRLCTGVCSPLFVQPPSPPPASLTAQFDAIMRYPSMCVAMQRACLPSSPYPCVSLGLDHTPPRHGHLSLSLLCRQRGERDAECHLACPPPSAACGRSSLCGLS